MRVAAGALPRERDPECAEGLLHLLEVLELLARQAREREREPSVLGVREHERERARGGFLLAVGVIEQQLRQMAQRVLDPRRRGGRLEDRGAVRRERRGSGRSAHPEIPRASHASSVCCSASAASSAVAMRSAGVFASSRSRSGCTASNCAGSCGIGSLRCL